MIIYHNIIFKTIFASELKTNKKNQIMKKTYYYCPTDSYGQRTGETRKIKLAYNDLTFDRYGNKLYKGIFLYDSLLQATRAALS